MVSLKLNRLKRIPLRTIAQCQNFCALNDCDTLDYSYDTGICQLGTVESNVQLPTGITLYTDPEKLPKKGLETCTSR